MANYISVENQTLLWKTIQKIPQFYNNTLSINKEKWFASIIKQFYEQIQTPKLTVIELKNLNQQTISFMIQELRRIEEMRKGGQGGNTIQPPSSPINQSIPSYETPQSRMSMYTDQFNARQQEYTNMIKPPAPPIANFGEKIEDEAITNMDELLQHQIKQREYDIAQVKMPPPPPNLVPGLAQTSTSPISSPIKSAIFAENMHNTSMPVDIQRVLDDLRTEVMELRKEVQMLKEQKRVEQPTVSMENESAIGNIKLLMENI
jgi:hypothetical protein